MTLHRFVETAADAAEIAGVVLIVGGLLRASARYLVRPDLPVQQTLGGVHAFAAFTLGAVEVLHDYHGQARAARPAGVAALEGAAPQRREEVLQ